MPTKAEAEIIERFSDRYRLCCSPPMMAVELSTTGSDYGSTGYTTRAQADDLATRLQLGEGHRVADIGTGSGWPGLYLSASTGCSVVGTDLPFEGLRRAHTRAAADAVGGRAAYAMATGHRQPFRDGSFDAVIHSDVLCCLTPKLSVLRECRRLLGPGGILAFTTIFVAAGLDAATRRRAHRAGPIYVATRRPYPALLEQAGFTVHAEVDLSADYERTQRSWFESAEQNAAELIALTSPSAFAETQADRLQALEAITAGLLRRSLFVAARP